MRNYVAYSGATCALALFLTALSPSAAAAAPPGPYLGGGVGVYTLDIDEVDFDDDAALWRAFGGYRLNANWAIEADYQRLTEVEDTVQGVGVDLDADAWTLSVRPIIPIGEVIDLYGRVGWTWYDAEASVSGFDVSVDGSDDDFTWGGGVDFHLGDNLTLRGDVSRIEIDDTDLNLVSASVMLRF